MLKSSIQLGMNWQICMSPPLKCQIICCRVPVMAGNSFEKVKLGVKEVAEIFTDSDTYLGSKDENEGMEFLDEGRN